MTVARFYEVYTHINMHVVKTVSNFQMNQNFQGLWPINLCLISPSLSSAQ